MMANIHITIDELKQIHQNLKGNGLKILKQLWIEKTRKQYPFNPYPTAKNYSTSKKPSNRLTNQIVDFFKLLGHQAERINTMGVMRDNRKVVTDVLGNRKMIGSTEWTRGGTTPGSADISATVYGMAVKIEVKIGRDSQSKKQAEYQQAVEQAGGIYYVAKDFQSFYEWVLPLLNKLNGIKSQLQYG